MTGRLARLKKRADFKRVAKGVRVRRDAFTLQAARRPDGDGYTEPRVGFTVTKKVGNAVVRNRIKRRLRAISDGLHGDFHSTTDYVIVARREALGAPFAVLGESLELALATADDKLRTSVQKRA